MNTDRLVVLARRGSLKDVAEAFDISVGVARKWTNEEGVNAPSDVLRRLLAVQALRRLGLYEDEPPTR